MAVAPQNIAQRFDDQRIVVDNEQFHWR